MYGIWVVNEWMTNTKRQILLFETEGDAETIRVKLDKDPDRPMVVRTCILPGIVYEGKLLDDDIT